MINSFMGTFINMLNFSVIQNDIYEWYLNIRKYFLYYDKCGGSRMQKFILTK